MGQPTESPPRRRTYNGTCAIVLMGAMLEGHGPQLRELVDLARSIGLKITLVQHLEPTPGERRADPVAVVESPTG